MSWRGPSPKWPGWRPVPGWGCCQHRSSPSRPSNLALAGAVFASRCVRLRDLGRAGVLVAGLGVADGLVDVIGILGEDPVQAAPGLVEQFQCACALLLGADR